MSANTIDDNTYVNVFIGDTLIACEHYYSLDGSDRAILESLNDLAKVHSYNGTHSDSVINKAPNPFIMAKYLIGQDVRHIRYFENYRGAVQGAFVVRAKEKNGGVEYVSHFLNLEVGGFGHGYYTKDLTKAIEDCDRRADSTDRHEIV